MVIEENNLIETLQKEVATAKEARRKIPVILQKAPSFSPLSYPTISVICVGFNNGPYLRDTLNSILNQTYKSLECLVIDGGSTDETVSILKEYPNIKWVSEKDKGTLDAMWKALKMAKGQYVMSCYVTDGYLDSDWLKKCAEALDNDPEISLVWGLPQYLWEDGTLGEISYEQFHQVPPPQKEKFIYYWMQTKFSLPEGNFCVRKNIFEKCLEADLKSTENYWLEFNYRFFASGYLPYFIPSVANFGRKHPNSSGHKKEDMILLRQGENSYRRKAEQFKKDLTKNKISYRFINPDHQPLAYSFDINKYYQVKTAHRRKFSYLVKSNIKKVLPQSLKMAIQKYVTKSIPR